MSLFLQQVEWQFDHGLIGQTLMLEFKVYNSHTDPASKKIQEFMKFFTDMGEAQWTSDKLMALAQLMFEVEQASKKGTTSGTPTITAAEAFHKYGKVLSPGDILKVASFPLIGDPWVAPTMKDIVEKTYVVV